MTRFLALVKTAFLQLLYGFKTPSKRNGKATGGKAFLFLIGIALYISIAYSFMFAEQLEQLGRLDMLIFMMATVAAVMSLMLTAFAAGGLLFGGKDADLLLSLPVSAFEVMLSKTLALYIENAVFALFFMLPAGVIYMIKTGEFSLLFVITLILSALALALITTLLSFVIGFFLTWLFAKTKSSKLVSNLLYFAFFGAVMAIAFGINGLSASFVMNADNLAASGVLRIFSTVSRAAFGDIGALALLFICAGVPFVLVVWLLSRFYKRVINSIAGVKTRSDYRLKAVKSTSQFAALIRKEAQRYFGTPLYLFNTGFGLLLLVAAAVFALIRRAHILDILSQIGFENIPGGIISIAAGCVCFLVTTSCCASISISLERDRLWILKESPVETMSIFHAKAGFNLLLNGVALLVCCPLLGLALSLSPLDTAGMLLLGLSLSGFMAYAGLLINLRFPKLDALNDVVIIKQSLAAMLPVLAGMLLVGGSMALYITLIAGRISFWTFALICTALLAGLATLCIRLLGGWGSKRFAEL